MNAIAGGGTLVTFPAIVGLGVPPLIANATSTVALWPGVLGSLWGYRPSLAGARAWVARFTAPSLLGGAVGAWLLLITPPEKFDRIVPFLVLGATLLFMVQEPLIRRLRARRGAAPAGLAADPVGAVRDPGPEVSGADRDPSRNASEPAADPRGPLWLFLAAQFAVGVYGGYFGAGIGIMMLAVLGLIGFTDIHRMNGLKNWGGLCMNAVAAVMFAVSGIVNWPVALAMAVGGIVGGYGASRLAQRVGQQPVRRAIVTIGLGSFVWLLLRPT
jgi:hypothetical protein